MIDPRFIFLTFFRLSCCFTLLTLALPLCAIAQKSQLILLNQHSKSVSYKIDSVLTHKTSIFFDTLTQKFFDGEPYHYRKFIHLIIKNNGNTPKEILINWGNKTNVFIYQYDADIEKIQKTGLAIPHAQKEVDSPIITKNHSRHNIYARDSSQLYICLEDVKEIPRNLTIEISESTHWTNDLTLHRLLQGMFLGFMILFMILTLIIYLSNFTLAYLYLFLYILGMFGRFVAFHGFLDWCTVNQIQDYLVWISFSQMGAVFLILFTRDTLLVKTKRKWSEPLIWFLIGSRVIVLVGIIIIYSQSFSVDFLGKIIGSLDLFILPIAFWLVISFSKRDLFARYLLISTLCLLFGLLLGVIARFDFIYFTGGIYSFQLGITAQLLFICLGMGVQIKNRIKSERNSQAKVLVLQKEINTRLELKVKERTEALQQANQAIMVQNNELQVREKEYLHINNHLESLVEVRTLEIKKQNELLRNYAYFNAHKVRGPLARILGLIYLIKLEPIISADDFSLFIERLSACANELDQTIREVNDILSDDDEDIPSV